MKIRNKKGKEFDIPEEYREHVTKLIESGNAKAVDSFVRKLQYGQPTPVNLEGYNPDSPHRDNPFNIIPGDTVTMERVKHPLLGAPIDRYGNVGSPIIMKPGSAHRFPGAKAVIEVPTKQFGDIADPTMYSDEDLLQIGNLPYGDPGHSMFRASTPVVQDPRVAIAGPSMGLDELISKYNSYIDEAEAYNESSYPKGLADYSDLSQQLRGYAEGQFASSVLGNILQNPYTQAGYKDQGFADAQRQASRLPQYLLDTQRAAAESQMSDIANRLIANGAKPTEVASMMAPYYGKMVEAQNEAALKRFQINSKADSDYYGFLTEIGNANTLADVENRNNIIQAQNKQVQNFADSATDRFRNLADLAAQELTLRRGVEKQYTDNLFKTALMRLGVAGPELEYRMRERELGQRDGQMQDAMGLFRGSPVLRPVNSPSTANATPPATSTTAAQIGAELPPDNLIQPRYEIPFNPAALVSYPEDAPDLPVAPRGGGRGPTVVPRSPAPQPQSESILDLLPPSRGFTVEDTPYEWRQSNPMIETPVGMSDPGSIQRGFTVEDTPNLRSTRNRIQVPEAVDPGFNIPTSPAVSLDLGYRPRPIPDTRTINDVIRRLIGQRGLEWVSPMRSQPPSMPGPIWRGFTVEDMPYGKPIGRVIPTPESNIRERRLPEPQINDPYFTIPTPPTISVDVGPRQRPLPDIEMLEDVMRRLLGERGAKGITTIKQAPRKSNSR